MKYYLITGTSRGLGAALAEALLGADAHLICIARHGNPELAAKAQAAGARYTEYAFDLSDLAALPVFAEVIFEKIAPQAGDAIYLVNNAGQIAPLKRTEAAPADAVLDNLAVNLAAPMLLTAAFVRAFQHFAGVKRVVNISSGAGRNAMPAWSAYCAAKAGLDRYTQAVALEQASQPHPVHLVSFAPGILDTAMQDEIRATAQADFPMVGKFIGFKEKGQLLTPQTVALAVIGLFADTASENGALLHISERG